MESAYQLSIQGTTLHVFYLSNGKTFVPLAPYLVIIQLYPYLMKLRIGVRFHILINIFSIYKFVESVNSQKKTLTSSYL